jgi:hypothetical protein
MEHATSVRIGETVAHHSLHDVKKLVQAHGAGDEWSASCRARTHWPAVPMGCQSTSLLRGSSDVSDLDGWVVVHQLLSPRSMNGNLETTQI